MSSTAVAEAVPAAPAEEAPKPKQLSDTQLDTVVGSMRDLHDEKDRWRLADVLAKLVPLGTTEFGRILDRATGEGVAGNLSVKSLELYRNTALLWPADKRIAGITFSAHRETEAYAADKGITAAVGMLNKLAKAHGSDGVTVKKVREAVAVAQNRPLPAARQQAAPKAINAVADLRNGGKELIAAIGPDTDLDALDQLHAGLTKVISHVEKLRGKAARKAEAATKKAAPAKEATKKAAPSEGGKGDLRDL